mgnify:CR=1
MKKITFLITIMTLLFVSCNQYPEEYSRDKQTVVYYTNGTITVDYTYYGVYESKMGKDKIFVNQCDNASKTYVNIMVDKVVAAYGDGIDNNFEKLMMISVDELVNPLIKEHPLSVMRMDSIVINKVIVKINKERKN